MTLLIWIARMLVKMQVKLEFADRVSKNINSNSEISKLKSPLYNQHVVNNYIKRVLIKPMFISTFYIAICFIIAITSFVFAWIFKIY